MDNLGAAEPNQDEYLPKKRNYRLSYRTRKKLSYLKKLPKYTSETDVIENAVDALYESETHAEYTTKGRKFE